MLQPNLLSSRGRGVLSLMLAWAVCSLPLLADDAAEATFNRNAEREWTDVNGVTITGRFSGVIRDEVLINTSGRVQRVKLSTLSEADIAWLWGLHNQEGKLNQLPAEYREQPVISEPAATPDDTSLTQPMPSDSGAAPSDAPMATTGNASDNPGAAANVGESATDQRAGRTWTVNGNPIQGKFSGVIGTEILINVNNRVQRFELSELSDYDLAWVWDIYNALGKLDDLPVDYRIRPENPVPPDGSAPTQVAGDTPTSTSSIPAASTADLRDERTWTDREGNTIQGSFSSVRGEDVSIFRGHGIGWQDVHLAQLARNDLIWLQNALRNEGRLSELSLVFRDPPDADASDSELVRQRRQGGLRQWKLYNGQTFVGAFHRVENGIVQVYDNEQALREEYWNDLKDEDHAYLKERLGLETPAEFFPAQRDLMLSPEEQSAGMRVWTDRERNQIIGSFSYLTAMNTVAIFNTPAGEARYIYEYISNDDQAIIQGVNEQNQQTQIAQGGTAGANNGFYSSNVPSYGSAPYQSGVPSAHGGGASIPHAGIGQSPFTNNGGPGINIPQYDPFNSGANQGQPSYSSGPEAFQPAFNPSGGAQLPDISVPVIQWTYKCSNCGAEFNESSGLKQGDPCPKCSGRFRLPWWAYGAIVLVPLIIRKVSR